MQSIDKDIFLCDLILTQQYCQLQLTKPGMHYASILRSCNPLYGAQPIFEIELRDYNFPLEKACVVKWTADPIDKKGLFEELFEFQLMQKKEAIDKQGFDLLTSGAVVVVDMETTVMDGASEAQSYGFFDIYDYPPIDTWFYIWNRGADKLLFAWIPEPYIAATQDAIDVNCVDCIGWFKDWLPKEFNRIMQQP